MKIIRYNGKSDVDIEFLDDFHYIKRNQLYANFVSGGVKNPYDRTVYGVGYIGVGEYKPSINKKNTQEYDLWKNMLERCYCEKRRHRAKTYINCEVCEEWHNFQNFAKWFHENKFECKDRLHVDKDIIKAGNQVYCPQYCLLVPQKVNVLFVNKSNNRGLPNGIHKYGNKYTAKYNHSELGSYNTLEEAYETYAKEKKKEMIRVANEYKSVLPKRTYDYIVNYELKIENDKNYAA